MVRPEDRLTLGFFRRLVTPDDEEAFVDGCRELVLGDEEKALGLLEGAVHLADGAYLAGFLALKRERLEEAARRLAAAAEKHGRLGTLFSRYGISAVMSLPITDEVSAHVGPDLRGALLGLVEAYQRLERREDAIACLERLRRLEPDDVVVRLSLAELLVERAARGRGAGDGRRRDKAEPRDGRSGRTGGPPGARGPGGDRNACRRVVRLAAGVENETPVHAALLLYKARALRGLGLPDAARETLTAALRRRKDRPGDLLRALRYERALAYEELGRYRRARGELERIYAEAPDHEDVAARLGL
jgi:tetratricopeptide (TPR) repeat protein